MCMSGVVGERQVRLIIKIMAAGPDWLAAFIKLTMYRGLLC